MSIGISSAGGSQPSTGQQMFQPQSVVKPPAFAGTQDQGAMSQQFPNLSQNPAFNPNFLQQMGFVPGFDPSKYQPIRGSSTPISDDIKNYGFSDPATGQLFDPYGRPTQNLNLPDHMRGTDPEFVVDFQFPSGGGTPTGTLPGDIQITPTVRHHVISPPGAALPPQMINGMEVPFVVNPTKLGLDPNPAPAPAFMANPAMIPPMVPPPAPELNQRVTQALQQSQAQRARTVAARAPAKAPAPMPAPKPVIKAPAPKPVAKPQNTLRPVIKTPAPVGKR